VNFEETPFGTKIIGLPETIHAVANDSVKVELLESRVRELEAAVKDWHKVADQRSEEIIRLEAERDRLKSCLYGLLEALQARHINELITKTPEHLIKFGEVVKDSYQEKAAEVIDLRARHAALVEAAKGVYRVYNLQNGTSFEMHTPCIDKLKDALAAEVK
jgi:hypothetical protein